MQYNDRQGHRKATKALCCSTQWVQRTHLREGGSRQVVQHILFPVTDAQA
jgi:hypothetical protein